VTSEKQQKGRRLAAYFGFVLLGALARHLAALPERCISTGVWSNLGIHLSSAEKMYFYDRGDG